MNVAQRAVWRKRGSGSPESLCEFGSFVPVQTAVKAPPSPSRWDVIGKSGKRSAIWKRKRQSVQTTIEKFEKVNDKNKNRRRMVQRYFLDSWLLPCSLRSHRTANPRPKMGFAIFRLCPPTTLKCERTRRKIKVESFVQFDRLKKNIEMNYKFL